MLYITNYFIMIIGNLMALSNENILHQSPWGDNKPENSGTSNNHVGFDELLRRTQAGFHQTYVKKFGGKRPKNIKINGIKLISLILVILLSIWFSSGVYVIDEGEKALVLRFGKYVRTSNTGLNYHLPSPIEYIVIEKVETLRKEEIGFRTIGGGASSDSPNGAHNVPQESLMLTGDENIVDINFIVQWKIDNLKDYVFNIFNPRETVRNVAESAVREVIGSTPIDKAIKDGRLDVEQESKKIAQNILNSYNSGVEITTLKLLRADPPMEVIDAFRDVQTAKTDQEREINRADAFSNEVIPRARGEASRIILDSEAYKKEVVERAKGEAGRFELIYAQYKNAKDITKKRLYLEAMQDILQGMEKIIIDNKNGVVPYLPLNQFDKNR